MSKIAIIVENVVKNYNALRAVDNLSFKVPRGQCFGFLGPNGAGKTTMMKILYGSASRDSTGNDQVSVFGFDPVHDELEIKFITGIVPQEDNLDLELGVEQNLRIYSRFYGMPKKIARERISEILDFMELGEKRSAPIRALSGGMKRRLTIARALLNKPKLLILDEPTTGLDPQVRHHIWDKLRTLRKSGVTILLTTHYMEEAYQICDDIIIMNKGKKVLQGPPGLLIRNHIEQYVLEVLNTGKNNFEIPDTVRNESANHRQLFYADDFQQIKKISDHYKSGEFILRQSNLEDVFLRITGNHLHE